MQISSGMVIQFNVCLPYWFNTWLMRQPFLIQTQMTLTSLEIRHIWNIVESRRFNYILGLPLKSIAIGTFSGIHISRMDFANAMQTVNSAHKSTDLKTQWCSPLVDGLFVQILRWTTIFGIERMRVLSVIEHFVLSICVVSALLPNGNYSPFEIKDSRRWVFASLFFIFRCIYECELAIHCEFLMKIERAWFSFSLQTFFFSSSVSSTQME